MKIEIVISLLVVALTLNCNQQPIVKSSQKKQFGSLTMKFHNVNQRTAKFPATYCMYDSEKPTDILSEDLTTATYELKPPTECISCSGDILPIFDQIPLVWIAGMSLFQSFSEPNLTSQATQGRPLGLSLK